MMKAKMKNVQRFLTGFLLAAGCCLFVFSSRVSAAEAYKGIDTETNGSIRVSMKNGSGDVVEGGSLALYRVASVHSTQEEGECYFVYLTAYAGCDSAYLEGSSFTAMAEAVETYIAEQMIEADMTVQIGEDGNALFPDLQTGLYLVAQTEAASGYEKINSFIVSVPMEENGTYVYDVDASPKVELTAIPTETTVTTSDTPSTGKTVTSKGSTLPQTGFLIWPVLICASCGAGLILTGRRLAFGAGNRGRRHEA